MDIDVLQIKVVEVIEQYGRPPTLAHHLEKLGEEFGELATAVALAHGSNLFPMQQAIADECCDMINVLLSMMEQAGFKADHRMQHKLSVLHDRIRNGRLDRKWGKK